MSYDRKVSYKCLIVVKYLIVVKCLMIVKCLMVLGLIIVVLIVSCVLYIVIHRRPVILRPVISLFTGSYYIVSYPLLLLILVCELRR